MSRTGRPKTRQARHCATCAKELSRATRGEYCRAHCFADTAANERRAAGIRQAFQRHPEMLADRSRKVAEANRRPERRARSAELARERRLWESGLPLMQTEDARQRQGEAQARNRLSHIPLERQEDYRLFARKVGAKEAERIVLAHTATLIERTHGITTP